VWRGCDKRRDCVPGAKTRAEIRALRAARAGEKEEKDVTARKKGFKEYAPGFIHIDIKSLPRMPDETSRRYLFVAIDRASRGVFLHIHDNQSEARSDVAIQAALWHSCGLLNCFAFGSQ
jgi:hypothetical protein